MIRYRDEMGRIMKWNKLLSIGRARARERVGRCAKVVMSYIVKLYRIRIVYRHIAPPPVANAV